MCVCVYIYVLIYLNPFVVQQKAESSYRAS